MSSTVHINKALTSRYIIELLDENPDLEEILCPQSLYERTSETYLEALYELGITITILETKGRPRLYNDDTREKINEMINEGISPKTISKKLGLKVSTVYYLKDKELKKGPKRKYTKEDIDKVHQLKEEGYSGSYISSILNIPLRSVYHLLKQ